MHAIIFLRCLSQRPFFIEKPSLICTALRRHLAWARAPSPNPPASSQAGILPARAAPAAAGARYGRIVTFRSFGGVTGLLASPSGPAVVGVLASASTTSKPRVTFAKIT